MEVLTLDESIERALTLAYDDLALSDDYKPSCGIFKTIAVSQGWTEKRFDVWARGRQWWRAALVVPVDAALSVIGEPPVVLKPVPLKRYKFDSRGHVDIYLVEKEVVRVEIIAIRRFVEDRIAKLTGKNQSSRDSVDTRVREDMAGAFAETAVSKYFGVQAFKGERGDRDVLGYEVRGVFVIDRKLIVKDGDDSDAVYILVEPVSRKHWRLCGWLYGRDAKQTRFWTDQNGNMPPWGNARPAYFVPQPDLNSMATLPPPSMRKAS